jgi:hypothetical protein
MIRSSLPCVTVVAGYSYECASTDERVAHHPAEGDIISGIFMKWRQLLVNWHIRV